MVALHVCQVWWTLAYKPLRTRRHKSRRTLCQGRSVRACVHSVGMLCGYMPNSSFKCNIVSMPKVGLLILPFWTSLCRLDYTFWLDSTLKLYCDGRSAESATADVLRLVYVVTKRSQSRSERGKISDRCIARNLKSQIKNDTVVDISPIPTPSPWVLTPSPLAATPSP